VAVGRGQLASQEVAAVTTITPVRHAGTPAPPAAIRLARWSWAMLPVFLVLWLVVGMVTYFSLGLLGLREGDLVLMAHSVTAWVFDLICWAVLAAAPLAGVVLAVRARIAGGRPAVWLVPLLANVAVVLLVGYQVVDEIRMSYRG